MRIEIEVEGENLAETEIIEIEKGHDGHVLVAEVSKRCGIEPTALLLFEEDCNGPLDLTIIIDERRSGIVHHVHRAKEVDVIVNYNGPPKSHRFSPATRIQRVLDWAIGSHGFNIDPTIAPEMELALHGHTEELPKRAHIGRYVKHPHHKLELDLIRGVVPNGGSK